MIEAFIAAIAGSAQVLIDKMIVSKRNIAGLSLLKLEMLFIAIFMITPMVIWGSIQPLFFTPTYILFFAALVITGITANMLYFGALKKKVMCEVEPISLLATPMTIILAMVVFPDERSLTILIISTVAISALILSRFKRKHLDFDKYSWMLIGADLLCAVEAILVKYLLTTVNAVNLYGLRTAAIVMILFLVFRNIKIKKIRKKESAQAFANAGITSIEFVAKFFAISLIGVVNSSLILLLKPIIILLFSRVFFKEKISLRRGVGDTITIMCIGAIVIFGH
jgi:drug/metabolite transporter (DMT)-like permease